MEYIIAKIPKAVKFTEKEINAEIKQWITFGDHVRVRRQLIDFGFSKPLQKLLRILADLKRPFIRCHSPMGIFE